MSAEYEVIIDQRTVYGALEDALADESTQEELDVMAEQAHAYQHDAVPVDTGDLQSVLEIRRTEDGVGRRVGVFEDNEKGVDYALPVELGWTAHNGRHVPAQPYIAPSVNAVTG